MFASPRFVGLLVVIVSASAAATAAAQSPPPVRVTETADEVRVETDSLEAAVRKRGYVSGVAAGSFLDKKTGARDVGFGLHIWDFLMAPGWRTDGYERDRKVHGDLPKHYVEGPQICTRAKELPVEIVRGDDFVAVKLRFTFTEPGRGYKAGSRWEQTLVFRPGVRYVLSAERVTSVNDVDNLFYRIDMPGHVRHAGGDTFEQIYLSYLERPVPASAFKSSTDRTKAGSLFRATTATTSRPSAHAGCPGNLARTPSTVTTVERPGNSAASPIQR